MLTKPNLADEKIITCLNDIYGLDVATISFLPLGADFNTAVYRVIARNGKNYFLKLRSDQFLDACVSVPKYLADLGFKQIIPPLLTKTEQLCSSIESFQAILYPYVEGRNGVETKLSEDQWIQFGTTIKKLHSTDIAGTITKEVPRETFSSKWGKTVKSFLGRIEDEVFKETLAVKTAAFLKSKSAEIFKMVELIEQLTPKLQTQHMDFVLCHADIHGWNLIIDNEGALYIVDFDTLIFAPKERDLMFVGAGIWNSGQTPLEEESLFYKGYGQTNINQDAICYYRFERIVQDIGEYCKHIFLSDESDDDRMQSFKYLQQNFFPGGTIEKAYLSYKPKKIL